MNFKIETHMSDSNLKTNEVVLITKADFMSIVEDAVKERIQMTLLSSKAEPERQEERYMSRREVADLLKVDFSTLWRWNKTGILHSHRKGERGVLYLESEVRQFIAGKNGHV